MTSNPFAPNTTSMIMTMTPTATSSSRAVSRSDHRLRPGRLGEGKTLVRLLFNWDWTDNLTVENINADLNLWDLFMLYTFVHF